MNHYEELREKKKHPTEIIIQQEIAKTSLYVKEGNCIRYSMEHFNLWIAVLKRKIVNLIFKVLKSTENELF